MDYVLSPLADADLDDIWFYIASDNEAAAYNTIRKIFSTIDNLLPNPMIGRARPELAPDIRSINVGSYIIFYRASKNLVEIMRVLHGARDVENILSWYNHFKSLQVEYLNLHEFRLQNSHN